MGFSAAFVLLIILPLLAAAIKHCIIDQIVLRSGATKRISEYHNLKELSKREYVIIVAM